MTKSIAQRQLEELGEMVTQPPKRRAKKRLATIREVLVSFRLKAREARKLTKHAAANDENLSDFIRRILGDYLK